jgi:hypothetical protein
LPKAAFYTEGSLFLHKKAQKKNILSAKIIIFTQAKAFVPHI